jgi:hypothetical protein
MARVTIGDQRQEHVYVTELRHEWRPRRVELGPPRGTPRRQRGLPAADCGEEETPLGAMLRVSMASSVPAVSPSQRGHATLGLPEPRAPSLAEADRRICILLSA